MELEGQHDLQLMLWGTKNLWHLVFWLVMAHVEIVRIRSSYWNTMFLYNVPMFETEPGRTSA